MGTGEDDSQSKNVQSSPGRNPETDLPPWRRRLLEIVETVEKEGGTSVASEEGEARPKVWKGKGGTK